VELESEGQVDNFSGQVGWRKGVVGGGGGDSYHYSLVWGGGRWGEEIDGLSHHQKK
jgi:hypothetical protein